jgi:hypothetical protein
VPAAEVAAAETIVQLVTIAHHQQEQHLDQRLLDLVVLTDKNFSDLAF